MFPLRIHIMGSSVDIKSPVNATDFLHGMCDLINKRGADTSWTGYHQFETIDDTAVWIRIRSIDIVETILDLKKDDQPKPKAKRKPKPKPKPKAKAKPKAKPKQKTAIDTTPVEEEKDDDIYG